MKDPTATLVARLSALADPTRLRILRLLQDEELAVSDLADVVQLPQSTVSRHLKQLVDQGWLVSRREGTSQLYRMLGQDLEADARQLWHVARDQTDGQPAAAQDRLRLAAVRAARDSRPFFAGVARDWDRLRNDLFGPRFTAFALLALLDPAMTVIDLGCGTGSTLAALAGHVKNAIGIDNSHEMLAAAAARLEGVQNVTLLPGNLTALPLADASADAALMILSLSYTPDAPAALAEARRVLKPGGRLLIVDVLTHDRDDFRRLTGQTRLGYDPAVVTRDLTFAGFKPGPAAMQPPEPAAKGPSLFAVVATA
ncbi:MAG: metalloregulator ArsR/SmtB family transcription factor [Tepidisphaeraceae bacterium]